MANRLSVERQQFILRLLCEGNSLRGVSRVTGCHVKTVSDAILAFGRACQNFADEKMRGLTLRHVEVDEMWTFVAKKQARLTLEERETRGDIGDMYLWIVLDQDTKLIPSFMVGKRSADMARRLMVDLRNRLVMPNPHASDDHAFALGEYRPVVQVSTDGFAGYAEAVDLAFGPHASHGVIIKEYRNANIIYTPSEMVGTQRRQMRGNPSPRSICTSHVERQNCTVRQFCKRFTRLTLGFSKRLDNLAAAVSMYITYYNYCWRTRFPDSSGQPGRKRPTAAMMAGVTDRLYRFDDLFNEVIYYGF